MGLGKTGSLKESTSDKEDELWQLRSPEFYPALLVIVMQNSFCTSGGSYEICGDRIGADMNIYRKIIHDVKRIIDFCHG